MSDHVHLSSDPVSVPLDLDPDLEACLESLQKHSEYGQVCIIILLSQLIRDVRKLKE